MCIYMRWIYRYFNFFNKGVINIFICRIFIYVMYIIILKLDNEIDKM